MWVPEYMGIKGNEEEDQLAKAGAEALSFGSKPFCGLNKNCFRKMLCAWENEKKSQHWENAAGLRQSE